MPDKYDALKLENQLCFPLYACSKEIVRKYKPFLDELDLTYTQYIAMMVLWEHRQISVKDMGALLYLDIRQFIQNLKNEKHRQILIFFLYGQLNDREIADLLHTSRQYIYRTRKSLLQKLYHDLYKLN